MEKNIDDIRFLPDRKILFEIMKNAKKQLSNAMSKEEERNIIKTLNEAIANIRNRDRLIEIWDFTKNSWSIEKED